MYPVGHPAHERRLSLRGHSRGSVASCRVMVLVVDNAENPLQIVYYDTNNRHLKTLQSVTIISIQQQQVRKSPHRQEPVGPADRTALI
jgi:hypothetical protein